MIRSMTAFARVAARAEDDNWVVEIRSLNHRYFEFSLKIAPALAALENRIRDLVQAKMRRGKITVAIGQDAHHNGRQRELSFDESAIKFYLSSISKLKKKFKIQGELSVAELLKLPGIFSGEESGIDPEKSWKPIKKVLGKALDQAIKAKEVEGQKLAKDIHERLAAVAKTMENIEAHAKGQGERIFKKLSERIDTLLAEKEKDTERMNREVAFLAERSDITEEIVRMKSHLDLFKSRLKGSDEVGRELDFLSQEMNREVNTMTSKAQHFEISTEVVFVKGELEKIREQIQNIE